MNKLSLTTCAMFALAPLAQAGTTATYCGPASGQTCEDGIQQKVYLQKASDATSGIGNIGSQTGTPLMKITSDSGALNMFIDLANGFATITPTKPGQTTFNGIDISVPGYTFTQLVFDAQLTPGAAGTAGPYPFTITGDSGGVKVTPIGNESDAADTDKEFSITAVNGAFDGVDIMAPGGFDEIKHIEIGGLDPVATPEPAASALIGVGLMGLGVLRRRR